MATARLRSGSVLIVTVCLLLAGCSTPKAELQRARGLEGSGRYDDALVLYRELLDRAPANQSEVRAALKLRIGECLFHSGHLADAAKAYQEAIGLNGNLLAARLRLGEIEIVGNAPQLALQQAELVLAAEPHNVDALAVAGAAYGALGQKKLARGYLKEAFERDPSRENVAITLANLAHDDGDAANARAILERNAGANPHSPAAWLVLGRLEEQEGNNPGAEEAYRHAVAVDNSPETNLRLAQFLQRSARIPEAKQVLQRVDHERPALPTAEADFELIAGRPQQAEISYIAALSRPQAAQAKAPDRGAIAARLVEADLQRAGSDPNGLRQAGEHFRAFRQNMDGATAAVLEAEIALASNDVPTALDAGQRAVQLAGDSAAAHYVLGMARFRALDPGNALLEWNEALERDPGFAPAHMVLGQEALKAGALELAEEHIASVVRAEPGNFSALVVYAEVLASQKRYDDALGMARRAIAVDRGSPAPHIVMGNLALDRKMPGLALLEFEQAILLDAHSQAAMDGLMRTYRRGAVTRPILARMERTAAAKPASAALMELAGRLYADHRWYGDAVRCLHAALVMDPARTTARDELVQAYLAEGNLGAAMGAVERGRGPASALISALGAEQRQDRTSAIHAYESAVTQDTSGIAANNLAWLYAEQGSNLDRALELAHSANDRQPNNPAVLDTIGFVHLQRREYSQAINFLRQAISMAAAHTAAAEPTAAQAAAFHRHLAEAYLKAGQPQLAAAEIEIARSNPAESAVPRD